MTANLLQGIKESTPGFNCTNTFQTSASAVGNTVGVSDALVPLLEKEGREIAISALFGKIAKSLIVYYLLALAFSTVTYGAFVLLWGAIKLTFTAWLIGVFTGFTIG